MPDFIVERGAIEKFLLGVPSSVTGNHSQLVAYFGFFLTEQLGITDITPSRVRACYDAALIPAPANIGDTMRKSKSFVETKTGTLLHRNVKTRIKESLTPVATASNAPFAEPATEPSRDKGKNVVVVHGRDLKVRDSMFQFLRTVGLSPIEWNEAVQRTGRGSPYNGEVVAALFEDAQAIIVLMTPDERVELREDLREEHETDYSGWQPRPNVLLEGGMALALDEVHTILVQIGHIRVPTDVLGRNIVRFDGSSADRHNLIERLRTAGCSVSTSGTDWLRVGEFGIPPLGVNGKRKKTR